jgi:hypothetical protein
MPANFLTKALDFRVTTDKMLLILTVQPPNPNDSCNVGGKSTQSFQRILLFILNLAMWVVNPPSAFLAIVGCSACVADTCFVVFRAAKITKRLISGQSQSFFFNYLVSAAYKTKRLIS